MSKKVRFILSSECGLLVVSRLKFELILFCYHTYHVSLCSNAEHLPLIRFRHCPWNSFLFYSNLNIIFILFIWFVFDLNPNIQTCIRPKYYIYFIYHIFISNPNLPNPYLMKLSYFICKNVIKLIHIGSPHVVVNLNISQ